MDGTTDVGHMVPVPEEDAKSEMDEITPALVRETLMSTAALLSRAYSEKGIEARFGIRYDAGDRTVILDGLRILQEV